MKKNIIQVKGVKKAYKTVEVLKGVDFEVEEGGIFALLGSNGAGKTLSIIGTTRPLSLKTVVEAGYRSPGQRNIASKNNPWTWPSNSGLLNPRLPPRLLRRLPPRLPRRPLPPPRRHPPLSRSTPLNPARSAGPTSPLSPQPCT